MFAGLVIIDLIQTSYNIPIEESKLAFQELIKDFTPNV